MHMILYVLNNPDKLDAVLDAWDAIGVTGATIVESTGRHRRRTQRLRIPLRFAFEGQVAECMECNYTLFAVVESEDLVRKCIEATESVVGDLSGPDTGVIAAWPLPIVKGVPKKPRATESS
jgi:nitrogen regulatory protein PII